MSERGVAVITGASAGVGRATARRFAERGFDVALLARGRAGLEAAADDVKRAGRRALVLPTDVAVFDEVDAAAASAEQELGPIDVWVNNAMTTVFARSWDCRPDEFKRAVDVTFLGQVHGTLAALARMRPRNRGRIVNVGSALAFVGLPLQSAYCASKFACRGFFESVRAELLAEGSEVTIAMVHLPAVNTPQFGWCLNKLPKKPQPVPPIYQPEDCAEFLVRAGVDRRTSKVIGAWNKVILLGARVLPMAINQYAAATGVSSQQTDEPVDPNRPCDLWEPADSDADFGPHGDFDSQAGGSLDPAFLRSLPKTLGAFGRSIEAAAATKVRSARSIVAARAARR